MKPLDVRAARKTYRYQKARERFLRRNPLCAECERQGRVTVATELDHIKPAHERPELFWVESNWQALCGGEGSCHEAKTAREQPNRNPALDAKRERFERARQILRSTPSS